MSTAHLPKGKYDVFASLGRRCQPAGRLKRAGLREFSGPFDWFARQRLSQVQKVLEHGPGDLFLPENTNIYGLFEDNLDLRDSLTGYRSIHDIKAMYRDQLPEQLLLLRQQVARRRERLIEQLDTANRALLIRINAGESSIKRLRKFLDKRFPNTQIDILIINETPGAEISTKRPTIRGVYTLAGDNTPSNEVWLGSDKIWQIALSQVEKGPADAPTLYPTLKASLLRAVSAMSFSRL